MRFAENSLQIAPLAGGEHVLLSCQRGSEQVFAGWPLCRSLAAAAAAAAAGESAPASEFVSHHFVASGLSPPVGSLEA